MMDDNTWNMILGKAGELPGPLAPEIVKLAKEQKREFYTGVPQDAYPDELDKYRKEMKELGWDTGQDDEELFEFAMHETQYRDYKSGHAKKRFEDEIEKLRAQQTDQPTKTQVAVKEKKAPNRKSYSKEKADYPVAIIAYLIYSLNSKMLEEEEIKDTHNIWTRIGFWRNLMKLDVTYGEEIIPVYINRPKKKKYEVEIEEKFYVVEFKYVDLGEIDFTVDGKTFYAKFYKGKEGFTRVEINEDTFDVKRNDLLESEMEMQGSDDGGDEGKNIAAPIPGRIFKINAEEGSEVKKGEILLVIEAMKMENNIVANKNAKINKILVSLDEMVDAGTPLIEIE